MRNPFCLYAESKRDDFSEKFEPLLGGFKHERDSGTLGKFGVGFLHVHLDAFAQDGAFAHAQDVVPSEIVVQVLGGHTTEAEREVLQIVVEGVDVIDVVHALLMLAAFNLNQLESVMGGKALIALFGVGTEDSVLFHLASVESNHFLGGNLAEVAHLSNGRAVAVDSAGDTNLMLGETALAGFRAALVRLASFGKVAATFVASAIIGFVCFDNAFESDFLLALGGQRVQYLVSPHKGGRGGNATSFCAFADGETEAHTFDVLFPDGEALLSAFKDGFSGGEKDATTILATVTLDTVTLAELLDVFGASALGTKKPVAKTGFLNMSVDVVAVMFLRYELVKLTHLCNGEILDGVLNIAEVHMSPFVGSWQSHLHMNTSKL